MKQVVYSFILLFFSNFLIATSQTEQNYQYFNIPPHFFTKNAQNPSKIRLGAYFLSESLQGKAERLAEKAKALELLIRETWITEGEGDNNPKYNSQELDRETSFYFYNARHYDPEICRFVTADTVVDGELSSVGWNRYAYVRGNPIGYRENIDFKKKIGIYKDKNGLESPTTRGIIHYDKKGEIHIIPARPNNYK